jgi:hypothetical protein
MVPLKSATRATVHFPALKNFYAFGDSFDLKGACLKCNGGYPYQIIDAVNASTWMEVYHVRYTEASMTDILQTGYNNRTSQVEFMSSTVGEVGWVLCRSVVMMLDSLLGGISGQQPISDSSEFACSWSRVLSKDMSSEYEPIPEPVYRHLAFNLSHSLQTFLVVALLTTMNIDLNLVIQFVIAIAQMQLVLSNPGLS